MSTYVAPPPVAALTDAELGRAADLRARGRSWDFVANDLGRRAIDVTDACHTDTRFPAALTRANAELNLETMTEAINITRTVARDLTDPKRALDAAKYLGDLMLRKQELEAELKMAEERNDTRMKAEQLRADTKLKVEELRTQREQARAAVRVAEADARAAEARATGAPEPDAEEEEEPEELKVPTTEPELKRWRRLSELFWRRQEMAVRESEQGIVELYLWGGEHGLHGGVEPGSGDTRLLLMRDVSVGGRVIHWATPYPVPTDPFHGPFLDPRPAEPEGARGGAPDSA